VFSEQLKFSCAEFSVDEILSTNRT